MIEPGLRTAPANTEQGVTEEYIKAVNLNRKIITDSQLAQQSLYDMFMGLKEMRDSKLYKELGFQNFESYCENEIGISRGQAHKNIAIVEKLGENVASMQRFGATKLYLLTKLSEDDRATLTENNDLDNISVRELEKQVTKLKLSNEELSEDYTDLEKEHNNLKKKMSEKIENLENEIKELENRPIEVAVAEPNTIGNERILKETIKSLERENIKQNEALEAQYIADEKIVREMLEKEKQEALKKLETEKQEQLDKLKTELEETRNEYEHKIQEYAQRSEAKPTQQDTGKDVFKAYFSTAYDAFNRLISFVKQQGDDVFAGKTNELIGTLKKALED